MGKKRVLFIAQEISPYLPESDISTIARNLPQGIQELGKEIRTFMPRYGCINERRHQLHEVIRLSGINIIVNDNDHPLVIKVASIQPARMQVYFIDNEDYFQRKAVLNDKETGEFFKDNDERCIFFCKGVIETVKKLGWAPDIIHCHGWMTSLIPFYLRTSYKNEPLFENAKLVTSLYNMPFDGTLGEKFAQKASMDGISDEELKDLSEPTFENLQKTALKYSDAAIMGSAELPESIMKAYEDFNLPKLNYVNNDEYVKQYSDFYDEILESAEVLSD